MTTGNKPEINYPCDWLYKVIGKNPEEVEKAIIETCTPHEVKISHSHASSSGKYHSFNAEIKVVSEEQRLSLYKTLQNHPEIQIVL